MSRWLRFTIVLAAVAFVVGFRFSATQRRRRRPLPCAPSARATHRGREAGAEAVRLAPVVALPELAKEPAARTAARAKKAAAERKARAAEKKAEAARKQRIAERRKKAAAKRKREAAAASAVR